MALENDLALVRQLVLEIKRNIANDHHDDNQQRTCDASIHARLVTRQLVLLSEHQTARNTTNTTESNQRSAAERTLPLTTEIIGLEGHGSGNVRVGASSDEENTKVAHGRARGPTHDRQTNQAQDHVEDDDGTANVVLVAYVASGEHDNTGKHVGRGNETLRLSDGELEVGDEDEGESVCEGVGDGGGGEEDGGVRPDLPVATRFEERLQVEFLDLGVGTVGVDAVDDPLTLAGAEELPCLAVGVGEVDEEPVGGYGDAAGEDALDDENPAPAAEACLAFKLHDLGLLVGNNSRELS